MFVNLIKMMIAPVISARSCWASDRPEATTVGKVGGLAFGYFMVMSTIALAIGLVVGNLLHPGSLKSRRPPPGARNWPIKARESGGLVDFISTSSRRPLSRR